VSRCGRERADQFIRGGLSAFTFNRLPALASNIMAYPDRLERLASGRTARAVHGHIVGRRHSPKGDCDAQAGRQAVATADQLSQNPVSRQ
jgi:hypothetical protein